MTDTLISPNLKHLAGLDIAGGGQIVVQGDFAYVGHMKPPLGTSVIDVSDPENPQVVAQLEVGSPWSHTHKVRVCGPRMITNVEQDRRHFLRRGTQIPGIIKQLQEEGISDPDAQQIAQSMGVTVQDISDMQAGLERGYDEGGFKLWDISDPTQPQLLNYVRTHGFGVHRFDMDENYAYISTEMEGFVGNILVIYDIRDPQTITEVSRWWMPGQNISAGEVPSWSGYGHRLHHAMRVGNELWAAVWQAGIRVIDVTDITAPATVGSHNYHPWVVEPTHTILPGQKLFDGRRIALGCDEEHNHLHGQPHAGLWVFDVTDLNNIIPLSTFHVSELDSPWASTPGCRFGMHQFQEHIEGDKVFCAWFSGGLRVVDISDPHKPREDAFFIPAPRPGAAAPQSNDIDTDTRGLVYVLDRECGLDILSYYG